MALCFASKRTGLHALFAHTGHAYNRAHDVKNRNLPLVILSLVILPMLRVFAGLQAAFFEALCQDINPVEKTIVACFPNDAGMVPDSGMDESCFKIPYDILVLGKRLLQICFGRKCLRRGLRMLDRGKLAAALLCLT